MRAGVRPAGAPAKNKEGRPTMTWRIIVLLALLAAAPVFAAERPVFEPYHLDKSTTSTFTDNFVMGPNYYAFAGDGTYQKIARAHMGVFEMDTGTWTQDPSGELRLKSTERYENIVCGPVKIYVNREEVVESLPALAGKLRAFLNAHPDEDSFSRAEVERISQYGGEASVARIYGVGNVKRVSRAELEALFPAMGTFVRAPRRVTQVAVPVRFDGQDVLIMRDQNARERTNSFADHIRTLPRRRLRHRLFTSIPFDRFLEESQRRQPFMFHPQMNCDTTVPLLR